jgi:hypothetical protein
LALSLWLGAFSLAASQSEGQNWLDEVRQFEEATHRLSGSFVGTKIQMLPDPAPGLKEKGIPLIQQSATLRGSFTRSAERFRIAFVDGPSNVDLIILGNGKQIATYPSSVPPADKLNYGSLVSADLGCQIPFVNHFGLFWPGERSVFPKESLSACLEGKPYKLVTLPNGWRKVDVKGFLPGFSLTLGKNKGEVLEFGYEELVQGSRTRQRWTNSAFVSVAGRSVPTRLAFESLFEDGGRLLTKDDFRWDLSDLTDAVDEAKLSSSWPERLVLSTYDGKKGGNLASSSGALNPVESDYGSPAYYARIRTRNLMIAAGVGLLILIGSTLVWSIRRKRQLR